MDLALHRDIVIHRGLDDDPADPGLIHVYLLDLDAQGQSGLWDDSDLSADERQRAERLRSPVDRQRFITGRAIARILLARACGLPAGEIRLAYSASGKPSLAGDPARWGRPLHLSISHCRHILMIGLTGRGEIGVDVEIIDPAVDVATLAADHLPPDDAAAVLACPPDQRVTAFFHAWTRHEAAIKARGACLGAAAPDAAASARCGTCRHRSSAAKAAAPLSHWQSEACFADRHVTLAVAIVAQTP